MSVWNWNIDVGISKFFLKHAIRWHAHYVTTIALLLLHDAEQYSIHNPPTLVGLAAPNCSKGEPVSSSSNWWRSQLINMHRQRREVSWHVYAIQLQPRKHNRCSRLIYTRGDGG